MTALRRIADTFPDVELVYPVHLSPVVQEAAHQYLDGHPRIHLIAPLAVDEMHNLMARCFLVMTDSGGLQGGGPCPGQTVLVLRRETSGPRRWLLGRFSWPAWRRRPFSPWPVSCSPIRLLTPLWPMRQPLWRRPRLPPHCRRCGVALRPAPDAPRALRRLAAPRRPERRPPDLDPKNRLFISAAVILVIVGARIHQLWPQPVSAQYPLCRPSQR